MFSLASLHQVLNLIRRAKNAVCGDDPITAIEVKYLRNKAQKDAILRFNVSFVNADGSQRIIGFGVTELITLLKQKQVRIHLDATFKGCPKNYKQVMIISAFDQQSDMLVPCYYILMTSQRQDAYSLALFNALTDSGTLGTLDVAMSMHDYERAIINSVKEVFKPDHQDGCHFHWVQALRTKLHKKRFPEEFINAVLWRFSFMSILPRDQLRAAVDYVRAQVNALPTKEASKSLKKQFSEEFLDGYFIPTWIRDKQYMAMFNYNDGSDYESRM